MFLQCGKKRDAEPPLNHATGGVFNGTKFTASDFLEYAYSIMMKGGCLPKLGLCLVRKMLMSYNVFPTLCHYPKF